MSSPAENSPAQLRRWVYLLLIMTAVGTMLGRIAQIKADHGRTPFNSANDRSRWAAVRALVDEGTFHIDHVIYDQQRGRIDKDWDTIDKVRHVGRDGKEHFYSSKPPLLILMLAAEYKVVQMATGVRLADDPFSIARIMLTLTNVLPLALVWWWLALTIDRYGKTDWGRMFTVACAVWGTFLTTMAGTLNNHSVAGMCVIGSLCLFLPIWNDEAKQWWRFFLLGLLAAFAAANELPALSFMGLIGLLTLWKAPRPTLLIATPAVLLVGVAFFGSNYWVHGSWKMPYAHRSDGEVIASKLNLQLIGQPDEGLPQPLDASTRDKLSDALASTTLSSQTELQSAHGDDRWQIWDPETSTRLALRIEDNALNAYRWDNWYDYEGSYWMTPREGVDRGEESRAVYLLHMMIGHNGWFSLTPIWLLGLLGAVLVVRDRQSSLWPIGLSALVLLVVCVMFYVSRPQIDRNYGGVATGLRWLFWLIPVWVVCILPAVDRWAESRWLRGLAYILLAVSIFSAAYGAMNPWTHPWLFDYWSSMRWIGY